MYPSRLQPGDHVRVWLVLFWHHAIFIGWDAAGIPWVIAAGTPGVGGAIRWVPLEAFAGEGDIDIVRHARRFPPRIVLERALSRVGENRYNVLTNNCEQFANWCAIGKHESRQAQLLGAALAVGFVALVSRAA